MHDRSRGSCMPLHRHHSRSSSPALSGCWLSGKRPDLGQRPNSGHPPDSLDRDLAGLAGARRLLSNRA